MCEKTSKYTCDIYPFTLKYAIFVLFTSPLLMSWMSTITSANAEYCSNESINRFISCTSFPIRHRNTSWRSKETHTWQRDSSLIVVSLCLPFTTSACFPLYPVFLALYYHLLYTPVSTDNGLCLENNLTWLSVMKTLHSLFSSQLIYSKMLTHSLQNPCIYFILFWTIVFICIYSNTAGREKTDDTSQDRGEWESRWLEWDWNMKKGVLQQVHTKTTYNQNMGSIQCALLFSMYASYSKCSPSIHFPFQLNGNFQRNNRRTSNLISS